jgi:hypothetical protein
MPSRELLIQMRANARRTAALYFALVFIEVEEDEVR